MNVLFAVWEIDPFFKMGGLGDVARSLPTAIRAGSPVDIRVVIPYYKVVNVKKKNLKKIASFITHFPFEGSEERVEIFETMHPNGFPVYLIRNQKYLDVVKQMDTWEFFDKAIIEAIEQNAFSFVPDIIHCNDLHAGLIPLLAKVHKLPQKTMLTIHNLAYQGETSIDAFRNVGLDPTLATFRPWEVKLRQVNFLLEAIIHSDVITTVSPTYAKEIFTEQYGAGLNEYLKGKEGRVHGILNGIDETWQDPKLRLPLRYSYGPSSHVNEQTKILPWKEGKRSNKIALQKKLNLTVDGAIPMLAFIGRFSIGQKGLDIMHAMIRRLDLTKYQFVILGSGDKEWEERYRWFSTFYPDSISCNFIFDEKLACQIYAASDFLLIPSRYEPCGLIQMIAMLYGTLPIAHATGGLVDSIQDGVNGFLFTEYSSDALEATVNQAIDMRTHDESSYENMVEQAFQSNFSWEKSAEEYVRLYEEVLKQ